MVVNWNNPGLSTAYATALTEKKDRDVAVGKMDFTGDTAIPTGFIQWNAAGDKWEKFNGTIFVDLSTKYIIDVDLLDGLHSTAFAPIAHVGAGSSAEHPDATISVSGFLSAADKTTIDGLGTISTEATPLGITVGGTGAADAPTARTNLGLGTAAVKNHGVLNDQLPLMNATGYPAADGSLLTALPTAAGFGDAAVEAVKASGTDALLRADGLGDLLTAINGRFTKLNAFGNSSGTFTWNRATGTTHILMMVSGSGGGGAGSSSGQGGGGGGGAGAAIGSLDVTSISQLEIVVVDGGNGGGINLNGFSGGQGTIQAVGGGTIYLFGNAGLLGAAPSTTQLGGSGGAGGGTNSSLELTGSFGGNGSGEGGGSGGHGGALSSAGPSTLFGTTVGHAGTRGGGGSGGGAGSTNGNDGGRSWALIIEFGTVI